MTFRPANPTEPPQAAQTPIDPGEQAIEQIGAAVDDARENVQHARESALDAAESQSERDAINARFDAIERSVQDTSSRIETAITTGNAQLAATLTGFLDRLDSRLPQGSAFNDDDENDDGIVSIEEVFENASDPVVGAAAATGEAVKEVVDEAPARVHGLLRPLWGGRKADG